MYVCMYVCMYKHIYIYIYIYIGLLGPVPVDPRLRGFWQPEEVGPDTRCACVAHDS